MSRDVEKAITEPAYVHTLDSIDKGIANLVDMVARKTRQQSFIDWRIVVTRNQNEVKPEIQESFSDAVQERREADETLARLEKEIQNLEQHVTRSGQVDPDSPARIQDHTLAVRELILRLMAICDELDYQIYESASRTLGRSRAH